MSTQICPICGRELRFVKFNIAEKGAPLGQWEHVRKENIEK